VPNSMLRADRRAGLGFRHKMHPNAEQKVRPEVIPVSAGLQEATAKGALLQAGNCAKGMARGRFLIDIARW
jgi:hypothetical protein